LLYPLLYPHIATRPKTALRCSGPGRRRSPVPWTPRG